MGKPQNGPLGDNGVCVRVCVTCVYVSLCMHIDVGTRVLHVCRMHVCTCVVWACTYVRLCGCTCVACVYARVACVHACVCSVCTHRCLCMHSRGFIVNF